MRRYVTLLAVAALLSGCGVTGCGITEDKSYRVVVEFSDVLDLVPRSAVKVNDVTVGQVEKVSLSGWSARVRVRVKEPVDLPDNATAAVRQSSLLGEKFVALSAPAGEPAEGRLSNGDVIPLARTRRTAEVEEVLGALGLVLSGGGLDQLKTINKELADALEGREPDAKDAVRQLDAFVAGLDAQKNDIVRAIDALDRLSARLARQRETVGKAVDSLAPGLRVLAEQREQLTGALTALGKLGTVGTRVVSATRDDLLADLGSLRPILDQLVRAGDALPKALDFLLTFPFPPNITGAISGTAVNLQITLDLDATDILANLLASAPPAASGTAPKKKPSPSAPPPPSASPSPSPSPSIAPGQAPEGAVEGTVGGLLDVLTGGLAR